ncbi:MAG: HAD hydrolase-like protein [Atopobiaceae bacterium]|jgi:phosphoglycolate phosphatase|nr:HAD hydrolase-like protein [Atopobiaceae bacterium]
MMTSGDLRARKCVLFDFDGTLADTRSSIVRIAGRVLRDWGLTDAEIGDAGRLVGPAFPGAFSEVYGFSAADAAEITRRYRAIYDGVGPEDYPLFDGMREVLGELSEAGRRLAVTTSKRQPLVERMLSELGVRDVFEAVVGQTDPSRADKFHLIERTLAEMGATPDDAVMVGDRFYDVDGACAAGVPCACVLFGTAERSELEAAGAAAICETPAELARVLLA